MTTLAAQECNGGGPAAVADLAAASRLTCGDPLGLLRDVPGWAVDAVVTCPPRNFAPWDNDREVPEADYQDYQVAVLDLCFEKVPPGGSMFYVHRTRLKDGRLEHPLRWLDRTLWTIYQEIVWDRSVARRTAGQTDDRVYWLRKPGREEPPFWQDSVWWSEDTGDTGGLPVWLPVRCLRAVLPKPGGLVLDPFVGSGSVPVAAVLLGHRFIGFDHRAAAVQEAEGRLAGLADFHGRFDTPEGGTRSDRRTSGSDL